MSDINFFTLGTVRQVESEIQTIHDMPNLSRLQSKPDRTPEREINLCENSFLTPILPYISSSTMSSGNKQNLSTSVGGLSDQKTSPRLNYSTDERSPSQFMPDSMKLCRKLNFDSADSKINIGFNQTADTTSSILQDKRAGILINCKRISKVVPMCMIEPIIEESLNQKKRKFLCKYCMSESEIQHMVRPCLCKGSIQYVHQTCLQEDLYINYMNESREHFTRDLGCTICKHPFTIKTYQTFNFPQSYSPRNKKNFILFNTILVLSIFALIALITILSTIFKAQYYQSYLFIFIIACLICFGVILRSVTCIISLMIEFKWLILDRNSSEDDDQGQIVDQQALMSLITYFKSRQAQDKVLPQTI